MNNAGGDRMNRFTLDKSGFIERTIEGIAPTVDVRGQPVLS